MVQSPAHNGQQYRSFTLMVLNQWFSGFKKTPTLPQRNSNAEFQYVKHITTHAAIQPPLPALGQAPERLVKSTDSIFNSLDRDKRVTRSRNTDF